MSAKGQSGLPGPTHRSEKKRRYVVCNRDDISELWIELELCASKNIVDVQAQTADEPAVTADHILGEELHCRTCLISFPDLEDYKFHFKDDLHRFNIKLKLGGKPPVSQEQFCELEDGISSISGSDSEEDAELNINKLSIGSPKVYFQNKFGQRMALYKCLLYSKKKTPSDDQVLELIKRLPQLNAWGIIMLGGGHFAAAIYKGLDLTHHKTFHSYTVRAKQGGSQSSRDNKSGGGSHPKSAGASLRRYNEAAFAEHVQSLFNAWHDDLKQCHLIFYRATSSNQTIMFGGKTPLFDRADPRFRSIPFPTRRATLNEVKRVWLNLSTIELIDEEKETLSESLPTVQSFSKEQTSDAETTDDELRELEIQRTERNRRKALAKLSSNSAMQSIETNTNENDLFPGEKETIENISLAVKRGDTKSFDQEIEKLKAILDSCREEYHLDVAEVLNQRLGENCETLLHQAAMSKRPSILWKLLELGCNPSFSDALGKVPYVVATDKDIRDTFRRFMGSFPDKFDYIQAMIPSPLTEEIERKKAEKIAEKRKLQKQAKKEKKLIEKAKLEEEKRQQEELLKAEEEKRKIEEEKARFLALTDREKRALAAERRLLANASAVGTATPILVRCFLCGVDMSGKVPFEYNSNKFCSPPCLQKHRKMNSK